MPADSPTGHGVDRVGPEVDEGGRSSSSPTSAFGGAGDPAGVDDRATPAQVAVGLDFDPIGGRPDEPRHGQMGDCNGVVVGAAVPAVAVGVEPGEEPQQVGEDRVDRRAERGQAVDVGAEARLVGDVEPESS